MLEALGRLRGHSRPLSLPPLAAGNLELAVARTPEEIESLQRLRFRIFSQEMNAVFPDADAELDVDRYDPWCEHLMVREQGTGRVVGTYRLLTPVNASRLGSYYSETEFDLSDLGERRAQSIELGRSCIHPDYRNGAVIMLLWAGIACIVQQLGLRYVLGCASVSLRDGGATAAHVWKEARHRRQGVDGLPVLRPHHPYRVRDMEEGLPARTPPLIKGYFKAGAHICGDPAWDPDFNSADFPVFLDVEQMDARYRRHLGVA
jgi:putative hemolysin